MKIQFNNNITVGYATDFPEDLSVEDSYHQEVDEVWPNYMDLSESTATTLCRKVPFFRGFQVYAVERQNSDNSSPLRLVGVGNSIPFFWRTPDDNNSLPQRGWDSVTNLAIQQHFRRSGDRRGSALESQPKDEPDILPVSSDDSWWDMEGCESTEEPNALCALSVCILPGHRAPGLADMMIRFMRDKCLQEKYKAFIVPVRPTLKPNYKTMPFEQYLAMQKRAVNPAGISVFPNLVYSKTSGRTDMGLFISKDTYDPWTRKHLSLGGIPLKIAECSMVLRASGADWERVTGITGMCSKASQTCQVKLNEQTGEEYVDVCDVPGTLAPVRYYFKKDVGVYCEPNLWIRHV